MAAILCAFCKRSKTAHQPDQPTLITNATVVLGRVRFQGICKSEKGWCFRVLLAPLKLAIERGNPLPIGVRMKRNGGVKLFTEVMPPE